MCNRPFSIRWVDDALIALDQTLLPGEIKYLRLETAEQIYAEIRRMSIRGAGALGFAGAYGVYMAVRESTCESGGRLKDETAKAAEWMKTCRPTAVSLSVTTDRLVEIARRRSAEPVETVKMALLEECHTMCAESVEKDRLVGEYALSLLHDGDTILTHCNTGIYASIGVGSAIAPVYLGQERGMNIKVYADETRPLLQGARLTAHELHEAGADVTLICDNMAGYVMQLGRINAVVVGCDRIAANGDAVNKIGTYSAAVLARYHGIPFYVTGAIEDVDFAVASGAEIPIEERDPSEVTESFGKRTAPQGVKVFNPSFDMTPNELITAIILDTGIAYPPFRENLAKLKEEYKF